ncbi:MAG: hydrogenase expression/formation protein HypE [Clostridiales bacterium]|nr:hydrogenase expression/formation protein HypE [Clostridiales bacterium]
MKITTAHGAGGKATGELIGRIFAHHFDNEILNQMEDSAVVPASGRIALTTDSFVVTPLTFPGGDIGRLCVCGTVNDLAMRGAVPQYLTCGFILKEGLDSALLETLVASMAATAREAGVTIVAGDTKVVEGQGGLYVNTAGVGFVPDGVEISAGRCAPGDVVLVSGDLGDHHACILSQRMGIQNGIRSDCAPLGGMVQELLAAGIQVHTLRDVTRGGLATVLKELAEASRCSITLEEAALPVNPQVRDFCGLLGLDPLYMGNEGKLVAVLPAAQAKEALAVLRRSKYGSHAACIGVVGDEEPGLLTVKTSIGGRRALDVLQDEGLPRIC